MTIRQALHHIESKGYIIDRIENDIIHCMTGDSFHSFRIKNNKLQKHNYFVGEWEVMG